MKKIKLPSTTVLILASLGAFWLAGRMNPGFNPVGIMILLLIPVFIVNFLYPQNEIDELFEYPEPSTEEETEEEEKKEEQQQQAASGELVDDTEET